MFLNFIAVGEKFVNLNAIALIEDNSTETNSLAVITTTDGLIYELEGADADALFDRCEVIANVNNIALQQFQTQATPAEGVN